ncbi:MAG: glycosyltransferase [Bdellovibrionales bacterium]|nr:glycosyltransferase [Bdellovibrionales bacterium]
MELISVIVPTYNGARYLAHCLESIAAQQDNGLEIIVVDDGSTDSTLEIAQSFSQHLPLSIHSLPRIGSWTANSNRGVDLARGEFISFLHQDDFWHPQRLKLLRQVLAVDRDVGLVLHPSRYVSDRGRSLGLIRCPFPNEGRLDCDQVFERLFVQNFIMMPAPLIRRSEFLRAGGFDSRLWYTADWKLWLNLARLCSWHYVAKPLASFRLHRGAQTIKSSSTSDDFRKQHTAVLEHFASQTTAISTEVPARCAAELNVALAAYFHSGDIEWTPLIDSMKRLRLKSAVQLLRFSRFHERIGSRLLCGLLEHRSSSTNA